jgi:hypothetical protein
MEPGRHPQDNSRAARCELQKCLASIPGGKPEKSDDTDRQRPTETTLDGEHKTVTALFADIKGSTELMRDLDPEEARAIRRSGDQADDRCDASLRRVRRLVDQRRDFCTVRRSACVVRSP